MYITNSKKSTPAYMLHAELGYKAVAIRIKTCMISFWMNIVNCKQTKLSKCLYMLLLGEYDGDIYPHKWIQCIKESLISGGHPDLLDKEVISNPNQPNIKSLKLYLISTFRSGIKSNFIF